jgi:hypothetical protein
VCGACAFADTVATIASADTIPNNCVHKTMSTITASEVGERHHAIVTAALMLSLHRNLASRRLRCIVLSAFAPPRLFVFTSPVLHEPSLIYKL